MPLKLLIARASLPVAVTLFFVGAGLELVLDDEAILGVLLVPAGLMILARGLLTLRFRHEVMKPLSEREQAGIAGKLGLQKEHPFGSAMAVVIGLGWIVAGAALVASGA